MRTLVRWASRLYPSAWRKRYGAEFDALLGETVPGSGDLWDVLRGAFIMRVVRMNFLTITAACALAGALIAGVWSLALPARYTSTAVVRAELVRPATKMELQVALQKAQKVALSRSFLAGIIQRGDLYRGERAAMPLEEVINRMKVSDLHIRFIDSDPNSARISVQFLYSDPVQAQRTVQEIVAALQRPMAGQGMKEMVDATSLPHTSASTDHGKHIGIGLLAGLLAGLLCGTVSTLLRNRKRWSVQRIGAFAVAGMAAGTVIAMLIPDQYESAAVIRSTNPQLLATLEKALSDEVLTAIIQKEDLYRDERARRPIAEVVARMRSKFARVQRVDMAMPGALSTTVAVVISFRGRDRFQAQRVTSALLSALIQNNLGSGVQVEVLDPPSHPTAPFMPNRPQIASLGALLGLLLGFTVTRLRRRAMATA